MNKKILNESFERSFAIQERTIDEKKRTVQVAFSSEIEVERWFGIEILDHAPESVRLGRLLDGGAVLMDHNRSDQVGVIENVSIDSDRVGRATLRFGRSGRAEEMFNDVLDGIRKHISVGYHIHKYEVTEAEKGSPEIIRVVDWEPIEISFVSIPADPSVGVGRSLSNEEDSKMTVKTKKTEAREESAIEGGELKGGELKTEVRAEAPATPAIQTNVEQVRAEERSRISNIRAAANSAPWDLSELENQAIREGWSGDRFRSQAFELARSKPQLDSATSSFEEMQDSAGRGFSVSRALAAQVSGDWSEAGFEREVSQELARTNTIQGGGLMVPMSVIAQRDSDMTTAAGLVPTHTEASMFIDTLRAKTLMGRLGARILSGLDGNVPIPKKTSNATFSWLGDGASAADSDVNVGNVTLSAKHIGGAVPMSFQLLRQSSPAAEQMVRSDVLAGINLGIDKAAFQGTGVGNQPTGVLNVAGVGTLTLADTAGKIPTWAEVVQMEGLIDDADALMENLGYVFRSTMASNLKSKPKDAGSGQFVVQGGECNGYKAHSTTQVPTNTSLFGNFADVIIGTWGVVELIPERDANSGQLKIGCHQLADVQVRHAESFVKGI